MNSVHFSEKDMRFLKYMRVGRLATTDGKAIHLVPICPVFEDGIFYMGSHGRTRKVRNLRQHNQATLLIDQYSEDWMRHVGIMIPGTVEVLEGGAEFDKARNLLKAKFHQYNELFPLEGGESVILRFQPDKVVAWDYVAGEMNEPH